MTDVKLDAKKIGYLRRMPAHGRTPMETQGPVKSMWKKLSDTGYAAMTPTGKGQAFVRTELGDEAVRYFDANLSDMAFETLSEISQSRRPKFPPPPGLSRLIDSGLVWVGHSTISTTEAGVALIAARTPAGPQP